MNAMSSPPLTPDASLGTRGSARDSGMALSMKWTALQDAAGVVAGLAGLGPERLTADIRNFPARVRDTGADRRRLAANGIDDLAAVMEPGLAALSAVIARGADARPAALALWRDFQAARAALLTLAPSHATLGPRRSA